jgi:hypothetical protein
MCPTDSSSTRKRSADCIALGIFTAVPRRESKRRLASRDAASSPRQSSSTSNYTMPSVVSTLDMTKPSVTVKLPLNHFSMPRAVTYTDFEPLPLRSQNNDITGIIMQNEESELFAALFAPPTPLQDKCMPDILGSFEVAAFALRFNVGSSRTSSSVAANALLSASIRR